jgi:hypothetical protein
MDTVVESVDVWAASLPDKPGALANLLGALSTAGADLQFIISRRAAETPGMGVVFVTPLQGDAEIAAAAQLGFNVTKSLHSIRIMGRNRPGAAAELTEKLAGAGINLRGFSGSVIGPQYVAYVALDTQADAEKAMRALNGG